MDNNCGIEVASPQVVSIYPYYPILLASFVRHPRPVRFASQAARIFVRDPTEFRPKTPLYCHQLIDAVDDPYTTLSITFCNIGNGRVLD